MIRVSLLFACALVCHADTFRYKTFTPAGVPIYTDLDLNGDPCGGYRRDLNCVQWIPLPPKEISFVPPVIVPEIPITPATPEIPDAPYVPSSVPEPRLTALVGLVLTALSVRRRRRV